MSSTNSGIQIVVTLPELSDDPSARDALRSKLKHALRQAASEAVELDVEVIVEVHATGD